MKAILMESQMRLNVLITTIKKGCKSWYNLITEASTVKKKVIHNWQKTN